MIDALCILFVGVPLTMLPYVLVSYAIERVRERGKRHHATLQQLKRCLYEDALTRL